MKRLIFAVSLLFVAAGNLFAQQPITLYKEFPNTGYVLLQIINTTDYLLKINDTTINIYDENFNLVKSVTGLPAHEQVALASKNLFTTSDKYEFILYNTTPYYHTWLYNEDKQMVYDFGEYIPSTTWGNKFITYNITYVSGKVVYDNKRFKTS